jgi:hypothetical protein
VDSWRKGAGSRGSGVPRARDARMPEDARQLWTHWEQHPWPIEERPTWVDG